MDCSKAELDAKVIAGLYGQQFQRIDPIERVIQLGEALVQYRRNLARAQLASRYILSSP